MLTVFKYPLHFDDYQSISIPSGAVLLSVRMQHEIPMLWALVDPSHSLEYRNFRMAGTGHTISENPESLRFVDTFLVDDGLLVFHVFEVLKKGV